MMEGKRHTNKPKAMGDDDTALSVDDFAFFVRTMNDPSLSVPKQVFILLYNEATQENNEMDQQANDATQPKDNKTQQNNNPMQKKFNTTTTTKETSTWAQNQPFISTYNKATQHKNKLMQQSNDATKWNDDESQKTNNPTQNKSKKTKNNRFTQSHPGINPQCPSTYLVHNANIKDEVFICHLLNEAPWKAPFGKVTCAWDGLMQKLLTEEHDGAKLFGGANVQILQKRYQHVYLHMGRFGPKQGENATKRKHLKMRRLTATNFVQLSNASSKVSKLYMKNQ